MTSMFQYVDAVGISTASLEDAIKKAVEGVSRAHTISWFEVVSYRGRVIQPSGDLEFQVTVRFGCKD
jgi:flavin-binding protein dodecin